MTHQKKSSYTYRCTHCGCEEDIPKGVVDFFDVLDPGDPSVPPRFKCEHCDGVMLPVKGCD